MYVTGIFDILECKYASPHNDDDMECRYHGYRIIFTTQDSLDFFVSLISVFCFCLFFSRKDVIDWVQEQCLMKDSEN